MKPIKCEMDRECEKPVAMIDNKGFIYCAEHGQDRKDFARCRKLRQGEINKLRRGEQLATY
jgi:hypothetical protein